MKIKKHVVHGIYLALLCAAGGPPAIANEPIDVQVREEIGRGMFLGSVVLAGTPDAIVFHEAYGQRDVGEPMQKESLFDVASITKVSTVATALAITMERRPEVSLDDLMRDHLPGITGKGADAITIRHTATHRSGLDNTKKLQEKFEGEALVRAILARDVHHTVGSKYEYSCLGMIRLGEMIARINGIEFGRFCRENIFVPLGMTNTQFGPVSAGLRHRCARFAVLPPGEIFDSNARRIGRPVGNSGLFTTAEDLSNLATLWLCRGKRQGKRFFSEEIWQAFTTKGIVWHVGNAGDIVPASLSPRTFSHIGWTGQTLIIDPERAMYIIVLTNRTHPAVHASKEDGDRARRRIAEAVVRALFATRG